MLLTEEQARTKWCPHARQVAMTHTETGMSSTANRDGAAHYGVQNCNCIASDCMAWRWRNTASGMVLRRVYKGTLEYEDYRSRRFVKSGETFFQFDGAWWRYEHSSSDSSGAYDLIVRSQDKGTHVDVGYCGLAGKVED